MKYLIAGLGNIGQEYARTRHNIGCMVLDAWAKASNISFKTERYGDVSCLSVKGRQFWLLKPSTYMNLSGGAVRYWMNKLEIPRENLIVVCDDLNLPFGTIRMRLNGSDGGHNGLKDIIAMLEGTDFTRVRVGIGNEFAQGGQIDFVLGDFSPEQQEQIPELAGKIIEGIKEYAFVSPQRAMNSLNTKKSAPETPENEEK